MLLENIKIAEAYNKMMNESAVPAQNTVNGAQVTANTTATPATTAAPQPAQPSQPAQTAQTAQPVQQTPQPAVKPQTASAPVQHPSQQSAASVTPSNGAQVKNESKTKSDFDAFKHWKKNRKVKTLVVENDETEDVVIDGADGEIDGEAKSDDSNSNSEIDTFLAETKTTIKKKLIGNEINKSWNDNLYRNKYRITLKNPRGTMSFVFWNSANSKTEPSDYDVLYAMASDVMAYIDCNGDLKTFANEFGYDISDPSDKTAKRIFKAVETMYKNATSLFTEAEIRRLRDIEESEFSSDDAKTPTMKFTKEIVSFTNDEGDYDEEYEELGEYSIELDELPEGESLASAAWEMMSEYDGSWECSTEPYDGNGEIWFTSTGDHSYDDRDAIEKGLSYTFIASPKNFPKEELLKLYKIVKNGGRMDETIDQSEGLVNGAGDEMITEENGMITYLDTFNNDGDDDDAKDWEMDEFDNKIKSAPRGLYLAFLNRYNNRYNGTFGLKSGDYNVYVESFDDLEDCYIYLLSKCRGCDAVKVCGDGKYIYITLGHHDGVETYKVLALNDDGINRYDSDEDFDVTTLDSDEYIKPIETL